MRTWYLASSSGPDFGFVVFKKLHVLSDHFLPDKLHPDGLRELYKLISDIERLLESDSEPR
jgi:hypothetical protein